MSEDKSLVPRPGPPVRLSAGPKIGSRSLYQQQVLDEDTYTDALSKIITRDFFPNLPQLHATNDYLTALTNNDPELLSASIRKLSALSQEKEGGRDKDDEAKSARRRELENVGTPYISMPGGSRPRAGRTPIGARGWDTPADIQGDEYDDLDGEYGELAGPSRPRKKRKTLQATGPKVRDDLTLDIFQRNYTSEDNASFVQIVKEDNHRRREERWGWAWEAEKKAEQRKLEGEERRKMILDAATSGQWKVDANGRRLIGGLAEGGRDRAEGEAWKDERRMITGAVSGEGVAGPSGTSEQKLVENASSALVPHSASSMSSALVLAKDAKIPLDKVVEQALPDEHPLNKALIAAGLPGTALVSVDDGMIVPHRDVAGGEGEGRGRGQEDRETRMAIERAILGDERPDYLSLAGSGGDHWGFKTRNNFMFPADANEDPYPKLHRPPKGTGRSAQPTISHAATRLPDDDEVRPASTRTRTRTSTSSSVRGSSPARSWIDAAVKGTPYRPGGSGDDDTDGPSIGNYSLVPNDPSPSPQDLPSLLTWGTLASTPRALDPSGSTDPLDLSRPAFKLPDNKRRDEIGRKLGNKASRAINERAKAYTPQRSSGTSALSAALRSAADKTQRSGRDKTPGRSAMLPPSTPRPDTLTPAARQLLQRSMGVTGKSGVGIGTAGRNRGAVMERGQGWGGGGSRQGKEVGKMNWTPSPAHR